MGYIVNMNSVELTALITLMAVGSFTPGPNTTLSTALAANFGLRRAMNFICAVTVGWGLLFALCAGGIGALVLAVPALRIAIKVFGVAYLLWLAYKIGTTKQLTATDASRLNVTFLRGVMLQFLNIKAWMLALTLVAGWIAGHPDAGSRFAVVLPLKLLFGFTSNFLYASIGSLLRSWLQRGNRLVWFNRLMAAVLVVTAGWMATF
jgi:threonine/homoserine/homoserine lactone efflux protein